MCYGHMWWGGGWLMMLLWTILLIAALILIIKTIQGKSLKNDTNPSSFETSIDILKKRYARGEISKEEFERMKKDLM